MNKFLTFVTIAIMVLIIIVYVCAIILLPLILLYNIEYSAGSITILSISVLFSLNFIWELYTISKMPPQVDNRTWEEELEFRGLLPEKKE